MGGKNINKSNLIVIIILMCSLSGITFSVLKLLSPNIAQHSINVNPLITNSKQTPATLPTVPIPALGGTLGKMAISIQGASQIISEGISIDNGFIKKAQGFSTTAILFSGDILASDVASNGDYYTSSRDLSVPSILHLGSMTWRHLSFEEQQTLALHNPLLTDSYINWTTDTFNTKNIIETRKAYVDPLGLLKIASSASTPISFTKSGAGLEQVLLYTSNMEKYAPFFAKIHASAFDLALPVERTIIKKGKKLNSKPKPIATKIYLEVFSDHFGAITRFLIVLPNKRSLMVSIDKYQSLIESTPNIKDVVGLAPVGVNQPVPRISKVKNKKKR